MSNSSIPSSIANFSSLNLAMGSRSEEWIDSQEESIEPSLGDSDCHSFFFIPRRPARLAVFFDSRISFAFLLFRVLTLRWNCSAICSVVDFFFTNWLASAGLPKTRVGDSVRWGCGWGGVKYCGCGVVDVARGVAVVRGGVVGGVGWDKGRRFCGCGVVLLWGVGVARGVAVVRGGVVRGVVRDRGGFCGGFPPLVLFPRCSNREGVRIS